MSGVKPAALLVLLLACNSAPPPPTYADADALPKELAPKSASAPPPVASVTVSAEPIASAAVPAAAGRARASISTAAKAVAEFQAAWTEEILPAAKGGQSSGLGNYTAAVADTKRLSARRMECRAGHRRVDNTLGGVERTSNVIFSSIPAMDRDGDCWEVTVPTSAFNEILGYFDARTGALIMAWLVPEG
ncbi:MAG: hypothetical protein JNK04_09565 [Myxococcales bacterium]|nr:hypothetical protein [Myxococcales bacterium]